MNSAVVILNRNLPKETDELVNSLIEKNSVSLDDIYVVEAGSRPKNISKHCSWHVTTEKVIEKGLRFNRGMNYGLMKLINQDLIKKYSSVLLLTNDTILLQPNTVKNLESIFEKFPRLGLLSPCGVKWGERDLLGEKITKCVWHLNNSAYMLRTSFIEDIVNFDAKYDEDYFFEGSNFRGYLSEYSLIMKAYCNDWAVALTTKVLIEENEDLLFKKYELINTESYNKNLLLYVDEGNKWLKRKFGLKSKWPLITLAKSSYDNFFKFHPEYSSYKL